MPFGDWNNLPIITISSIPKNHVHRDIGKIFMMMKMFSKIKNKNVELPDMGDPFPYPKENLGKLVKFIPK